MLLTVPRSVWPTIVTRMAEARRKTVMMLNVRMFFHLNLGGALGNAARE